MRQCSHINAELLLVIEVDYLFHDFDFIKSESWI